MASNIDSIIDSAKTEDEAISEISKVARKSHGDEVVDKIIDESPDEETAKAAIVKLARNPKQNAFDKNFWGTLDTLTPLGKALSHVMTPVTEAVRGPIQSFAQNVGENTSQTPPIDPLAEFEEPLGRPSSRAGFGPLLTDISNAMGIQQKPLANVDIKDMPTTSAVLNQLSNPAEGGGAILEAAMGTKNFKIPGYQSGMGLGARVKTLTDEIPQSVRDLGSEFYPSTILDPLTSRTNKRNMIANYVTEAAKDRGLLDEILENGQFEYMVDMLEQNPDLIKPFNKKGALDLMEGPVVSNLNPETNRMGYKRDPKQGQLGQLAAQQGMIIDEIPDKYSVNREDFLASALNELPGGLDASQRTSAERLISESVKPVARDPQKVKNVQRSMDLRDQIIETGGRYGVEPDRLPNPSMEINQEKLILRDQVRQLFNDLMQVEDPTLPDMDSYNEFVYNLNETSAAPFLNEQRKIGNVYKDQNSPFTDPRDVASRNLSGDALERAASEALKGPMSELPGLTQELYQDTNRGISTRRNYRDLLSGSRAEKDAFGRVVPQGDVERGIVSRILGSADEFVVPTGHKVADYLQRQGVQYGSSMSKLAPVSLQSYRIPRDSAQIMEEKEFVISKIGKEMGPQFSADLKKIDDPDAVKLFLRQIEQIRPDLFEKDPYARMDGVIENPILKQKALEDTMKNGGLSVLDKANTVEDLLINNRFLG